MEKKLTFCRALWRAVFCSRALTLALAFSLALALACSGCAAHSAGDARNQKTAQAPRSRGGATQGAGQSSPHGTSAAASSGAKASGTASPQARAPRKRASLGDILAILSGALSWSHQDWAAAASSFLEAERVASEGGDDLLREYAVYGLASTYLAQDEYDSALARLSELDARASPEIGSGIWYQAGIIAFRKGEYAEAAEMFRKSLEYDPSRADAKLNLELSKRSLSDSDAKRSASASAFSGNQASGEDADTVFNLVRKKEQDRWKNQEEQSSRENVADY